ncbi:MAG TPA: hypothetical protein VEI82_03005 [Myxococcota bacterium]|nr:hypothetical protein [Myxococcota bacterium]
MGRIKGVAFLGVVKLLRSRRDDAMSLLRPELHHFLSETVRPSGWYLESEHAELLRAGAQLYPGSPDRALELMGEAAARDHSELFRELLVGPGSPSRAFALWSTQHDTGELRRVRETANRVTLELAGFENATRELCLLLTGYWRGTFLVNGCSDVAIEKLGCRLWQDQSCIWRCTWKREL